jgi:hypothetical protein
MKALSIRQPWAWLIVMGYKDVENRTWSTRFRGRFLVHAGKKFDHTGYRWVASEMGLAMPEPHEFACGGIVGMAEIVDCVTQHDSPWFFGPYGFVLENARPLQFAPLRGSLGFFDVDGTFT